MSTASTTSTAVPRSKVTAAAEVGATSTATDETTAACEGVAT